MWYENCRCIFEGKETNFVLKRGWLFQNGKEKKQDGNLNVDRKVVEGE